VSDTIAAHPWGTIGGHRTNNRRRCHPIANALGASVPITSPLHQLQIRCTQLEAKSKSTRRQGHGEGGSKRQRWGARSSNHRFGHFFASRKRKQVRL
jgi:hypothetical protein